MRYYDDQTYSSDERERRRKKTGPPEQTGEEAVYLRRLIDSESPITVYLKSGERLAGRLRYYDRDYFSMKLAEGGLNVLIRKVSVLYMAEGELSH